MLWAPNSEVAGHVMGSQEYKVPQPKILTEMRWLSESIKIPLLSICRDTQYRATKSTCFVYE